MANKKVSQKTSKLAISSLVMGIVGIFLGFFPPIGWPILLLGLTFGINALIDISKNQNLSGKGLSIAGIIINSIMILLLIIGMTIVGINYPTV